MKLTNQYLFDFLDFDPALDGKQLLYRAINPNDIKTDGNDVVIDLPFQKQKCSLEMGAEPDSLPKIYQLSLRAYGDKILRMCIGFKGTQMNDSPMLEIAPELKSVPLSFEKSNDEWRVLDNNGTIRAKFNQRKPEIDHWSDLLPEPAETLDAVFYPDGDKEININAYDQFFPARHDSLALAFVKEKGDVTKSTLSFHADANEVFCGTGERFTKMDLSGKTLQLENQDGQGVNSRRTYKNIPFFVSSRQYGMFMHTSASTRISFADQSTRSIQFLVEDTVLDLFLVGGNNLSEVLFNYRRLTGFPSMPPLWSFGTWMSRMTYFSADEVNEICDRLRKEDYPCDVIHLDTGWFKTDWLCEWKFNDERFPDPQKFMKDLRDKGYRISLWQMPYIAADAEQHDEAVENKYIGPLDESIKQGGSNFSALDYAGTIDFTSQKATDWYKGLLGNLLEMGAVCIKTDFGEEIHMNAKYENMHPSQLRNIYALLYQKAAYEITKKVTGDGIVWARAGWAGCQRYPLHWGGDAACTWDGMAGSLKGGLHLGLSGFGFWSHDVPGFHSVPDFMNSIVPDDLYVRWTQFGVFSSHIRYHGTSKREPYEYPNISDIVRRWWKLRYALIPYIYEQAIKVTKTGFPVLRALMLHHPNDRTCLHIDDQYYFGDDFLVAPVMNSGNKRDVYLPEGKWVNFFDGTVTDGSKWLKEYSVSLHEMPVWVKYDAEIPVYPKPVQCTDEMDMSKSIFLKFDDTFTGIYDSVIGNLIK